MITRQNYIASVMLMVVLMFILMASSVLRDRWNDYNVNEYAGTNDELSSAANLAWRNESGQSTAGSVVLIGDAENECGKSAKEWATYTRRDFAAYPSVNDYKKGAKNIPEMMLIDSGSVNWQNQSDTDYFINCVERGINLVFLTLPDFGVVKNNASLRELLGIGEAIAQQKEAAGLYLYSGFLLGGEKIYLPPENPEESAKEQFVFPGDVSPAGNPVFDWYTPAAGTKTYMSGIPQDKSIKSAEYPALIWRKSFGTAYVFAVNGGYLKGAEGIGILSAIAAETHAYEIYPVINAQSMVFVNFPVLSDENSKVTEPIYGQPILDLYRDTIWTGIWRTVQPYDYRITCMMSPQLNYSDEIKPENEEVEYYLRLFNENSTEAGLSLISVSDTPVEQKVTEDASFFRGVSNYAFSSIYTGDIADTDVQKALNNEFLSSVITVVDEYDGNGIIDIIGNNVISQASFDSGFNYTYSQDFQMRCIETALGYYNMFYDMSVVPYPKDDGDTWEKLSAEFKTSVEGFGNMFPIFNKTTTSESEKQISTFLKTQYTDTRDGNTITLKTRGTDGSKWFILRTHGVNVSNISGGTAQEIEDGAYLITAETSEVSITLEPEYEEMQ